MLIFYAFVNFGISGLAVYGFSEKDNEAVNGLVDFGCYFLVAEALALFSAAMEMFKLFQPPAIIQTN